MNFDAEMPDVLSYTYKYILVYTTCIVKTCNDRYEFKEK